MNYSVTVFRFPFSVLSPLCRKTSAALRIRNAFIQLVLSVGQPCVNRLGIRERRLRGIMLRDLFKGAL